MPYRPTSVNFKLSDGTDLSNLGWITKDYLLSVYPQIGSQIGIPPELWAWGSGNLGVLGNASTTSTSTPITTFTGGSVWKQIGSGSYFTAAIKTDGTLWTWGNNATGQLGNASTTDSSTPVTTFAGGNNWKLIDCGNSHTAAVKTDGTLWVWGNEDSGRVGNGDTTGTLSTPVTTFTGGTNWIQVSCGDSHTVALKDDGAIWIWGNGSLGRHGIATTINRSVPTVLSVPWYDQTSFLPEELFIVSTNELNSGAIKADGTLWIWGDAGNGRLGNGATTTNRSTPVTTFIGGTDWRQVSVGQAQAAAIKTDGTLWIWGATGSGRLGNAVTTGVISTPVTTFIGGTNWRQVDTGTVSTIAVKTDGTLWGWGSGASGKLGNGVTTGSISTPVTTFAGGTNWKQVSSADLTTAAIKTDGTLWVWGTQVQGQLGNGLTTGVISTPVTTFAGGTNWKQVDCGTNYTAAVKTDGTLWTWGNNLNGRLGDASITNRSTPVTTFAGGTNWDQVHAGTRGCVAIKTDGTLWTWGNAIAGRLGNTAVTAGSTSTPVTTFAGGTDWKQASAGYGTLATKSYGTLWVWGLGTSGQLGDATILNKSTPITTFAGINDWRSVSAGGSHTSAIKIDRTLWAWGNNAVGQLGNASTTDSNIPVTTFIGGTNWSQLSAGGSHTAAVKTDGTLWTWGNEDSGRVGNGDTTGTMSTPVTTFSGGVTWKKVECATNHTVGLKVDGTLWTWGNNADGQLGNRTITNASVPVTTSIGGGNWKQISASDNSTVAIRSIDFQ